MIMFEILKHILNGQNQFASGGLLLMVLGSIGVFLRGLPEQLWSWLVQQTTMMITVKDDDDSFAWVKEWFLEQKFSRHIRRVDGPGITSSRSSLSRMTCVASSPGAW